MAYQSRVSCVPPPVGPPPPLLTLPTANPLHRRDLYSIVYIIVVGFWWANRIPGPCSAFVDVKDMAVTALLRGRGALFVK